MDALTQAFADRLEPDLAQFESNAALWRLEVQRHAARLLDDEAVGSSDPEAREAARVALEGVEFEIDRLQGFAREHAGMGDGMVLRLAEVGLALETARRRLRRALLSGGSEAA